MIADRLSFNRLLTVLLVGGVTLVAAAGLNDPDENGYVDLQDYVYFAECLALSPSGADPPPGCLEFFDEDDDGDIDLTDFAGFARAMGHLPMPLRDYRGNVITLDSTEPYSGRQTCGANGCHDVDRVTNGFLFQQGRTDLDRNVDMRDEYYGDGRYWIKSSGRYGKWGQTFRFLLAAKDNTSADDMEQTTFAWVRDCSGCHPGGGPGEFDRDGQILFDETAGEAGKFGYELLGKTPEQVQLDGDYSVIDYATGAASLAPWDVTGPSGPDCLRCHRAQRTVLDGVDLNWTWRANILATGDTLVDGSGVSVPAFAAAGTAGQGWFSTLDLGTAGPRTRLDGLPDPSATAFLGEPVASLGGQTTTPPILQIDYQVGVDDGSLLADPGGAVSLSPASVTWPPKDRACWGCHPYGVITGTVWFDDTNVLYRKFNNLNDDDPSNDIPPEESRVCTVCHIGDLDHNFGRGNSMQIHYRDGLDWQTLRDCRSCHLTYLPNGQPNPRKHPEAPDVPGNGDVMIHIAEPFEILSCQACHIPYSLATAVLFRDTTMPGTKGTTDQYYSSNPLDPTEPREPGDTRWYPALRWKVDVDGVERLFPCSIWITIYWGDWDQNNTPDILTDDVISPIFTTKVARVISEPLSVVTDDNEDGVLEINRPEEILAYLRVLRGDEGGEAVAANPVLVKGKRVWYEDPQDPTQVLSFEHVDSGIAMDAWYPYLWGKDHNVRPKEEAWGYTSDPWPTAGCQDCHRAASHDSPVFNRKILVDPYGLDGQPVYEIVEDMVGIDWQ